MSESSYRYCDRLHIPVPDPNTVAAQPGVSLFHVMLAVLLQHGAPMTFDEIVRGVERVALPPRLARADLTSAL